MSALPPSINGSPRLRVMTVFGTRPEIIKLAPVVRALANRPHDFEPVTVCTGQHTDLLAPFVAIFGIHIDHHLYAMQPGQSLSSLFARILLDIDPLLEQTRPDVVLVQGDTTTALAAAQASFHRRIPVGHVEAGLRTGDATKPFPEEMNRRLVTRLATWHFAATPRNVRTLLAEGVGRAQIALTGNPVVDALTDILAAATRPPRLAELLKQTAGLRRIVLTTHRRENFGAEMSGNLKVLAAFVERHADVGLIFPVHPNPAVRQAAQEMLGGRDRIWLTEPLDYLDFIGLVSECWVIVSDSGGVQEEAPTLGKPLLVLRDVTERPEAVECGAATLVGGSPRRLRQALKECYWQPVGAKSAANPFGRGDAGERIARALARFLQRPARRRARPLAAGAEIRP